MSNREPNTALPIIPSSSSSSSSSSIASSVPLLTMPKVELYNMNEIKNAIDDAIRLWMNQTMKYEEDHTILDGKLGLGSLGCIIASLGCFHQYMYGFEQTSFGMVICLLLYILVSLILTFWNYYVENNIIYSGYQDRRQSTGRMVISSHMKRFEPEVIFEFHYSRDKHQVAAEKKLIKNVACWFDLEGHLAIEVLEKDLSKIIASLMKGNELTHF